MNDSFARNFCYFQTNMCTTIIVRRINFGIKMSQKQMSPNSIVNQQQQKNRISNSLRPNKWIYVQTKSAFDKRNRNGNLNAKYVAFFVIVSSIELTVALELLYWNVFTLFILCNVHWCAAQIEWIKLNHKLWFCETTDGTGPKFLVYISVYPQNFFLWINKKIK